MITDLKELKKFFKLCREQGVTDITFEGYSVKFGALPDKNLQTEDDEIQSDGPTYDELIFHAVQNTGQI